MLPYKVIDRGGSARLFEENVTAGPMKRVQVDGARSLSLSETRDTHGSNVFAPFRTVGRVSDGLPHSLFYLGGVPYVATGLGHSFQILDVRHWAT